MLVGRPGLSPVMVGREAELDRLARLARTGPAPAIALLGGEAGIGKTRLVSELCARLPEGTQVLAGQADPGGLGRPFGLLLDALDGRRAAPDERLDVVTDRGRPTDERVRAGLDLLRDRSAAAPTVVVFDDLHWADSESTMLFERLAEPGSGPVLLIGTYRPDALTRRHPTAELLPRLERRHAVTHLHLDRLSHDDVSAFLTAVYGRPPSFRVVETLHARTGGNPFFLEELLAAAGEADPDELVRQPLPWSLGEVVRAQLEEMAPRERAVLETAAVLGRRVGFDLLQAVTGFEEDELIALLRSIVAAGLLVEAENDVFSFRHALAREAIEADLLGRERRRLHQAALDALRAAGHADLADIAHHAQGAGRYDEMVEAAIAGAEESLRDGSTYQALQLAELGLEEACDDLKLLGLAARAAWLAGLVEDATTHARRWLEVARSRGDVRNEAAAQRRLLRLRWEAGDIAGMVAATDATIELLDRMPEGYDRGNGMAAVAQSYMLRDHLPEAIEWADRAIAYGEELGDERVTVWGRCEKASALMQVPELAAGASQMLLEIADDAERLGEWVIVARALNNRVRSDLYRPDPEDARTCLERMRHAAERAGFDSLSGAGYWHAVAELSEWEGDLLAALGYFDEANRNDHTTSRGKVPGYLVHEAGLALEADRIEHAQAIHDAADPELVVATTWWWGLGAHLAFRRGEVAEGLDKVDRLLEVAAGTVTIDPGLVHDVLRAMLAAGAPTEAGHRLADGLVLGDDRLLPADSPWRDMLGAQLREAEGDVDGALAGYEAAIAAGGGVLRPSVLGTAHVGAARAAIALDRIDDARKHAEEAAGLLQRWTGWRVSELRAVQRRLGSGSDPGDGTSTGLTPREREVVALLAEGLTNGEIATRLFISPKTASVHVSNILAKLGMANRAEIAAYAVREGLT